jgi:PKD repeat protein
MQVLGESGATISANNCILSTDSATDGFASTLVTMTNTVTYRPGSGTNPNYVAPLSTWRGAPRDSMDSQTYGLTKGYNSSDVSYPTNDAPTLTIGATPVSGTVPLVVNFTATAADADGVVVACSWDFKNGGTSTLYNASTTYTAAGTYNVTCTVTDNLGATTTNTVTITATAPPVPVISRIEAGSTASFTDGASNVWMADHSFGSGGGIVDRGALAIANTTDDRIYQTERWGVSSYAIAVANGTYTVRLHFAETYSGITAAGQRVFSVTAEGATPSGWANIDVFAQAGGRNIALIKTATVSVTDGVLNLGFAASVNNTMISGIEVLPMVDDITTITGATTVTAGTAYTVSVGYVAAASRRVYVEFRSPANSILASSFVTVAAGSGTANVTVTVPSTVTAGTGYRWTSKLKGSTGSPEYDRMDLTNVTVN